MDRDDLGDRLDKMSTALDGLTQQLQKHAERDPNAIVYWTGQRPYGSFDGPRCGFVVAADIGTP